MRKSPEQRSLVLHNQDEYLDLVDEQDQVIGIALRSVVYKEKASNFRAVNAFLRNKQGQLWIPTREKNKRLYPNALDFSVGEHVQAGESYDIALQRGLEEELNMEEVDHRLLGKFSPKDGVSCFMQIYEISSEQTPIYNLEDFSQSVWLSPQELLSKIQLGAPAKSDLLFALRQFYHV